mgnify:CR=1 FL=1
MVKIHRLKGDISSEIAKSFKGSVAIDTEATGLQIPEPVSYTHLTLPTKA